ncbi:MAG: hypothetical protein GY797_01760 [Deltaproteobacteria bacterium]|nr:hypothetical protein [Deltaproteobacteria bacterium]
MFQNKIIIILCVAALVEAVYLGYQFFDPPNSEVIDKNQTPLITTRKELDSDIEIKSFINNPENAGKSTMEPITKKVHSPDTSKIKQTSPKTNKKAGGNSIKTEKMPPDNIYTLEGEKTGQNATHTDVPFSPTEWSKLMQGVRENDSGAIQTVMNLAKKTEVNRILHRSLQALSEVGTAQANQVLSDSIGQKLDNPTEVIRILSYFDNPEPLDDRIIDQFLQYADSPLSTTKTKKVILIKILKIGDADQRDEAKDLMRKINRNQESN